MIPFLLTSIKIRHKLKDFFFFPFHPNTFPDSFHKTRWVLFSFGIELVFFGCSWSERSMMTMTVIWTSLLFHFFFFSSSYWREKLSMQYRQNWENVSVRRAFFWGVILWNRESLHEFWEYKKSLWPLDCTKARNFKSLGSSKTFVELEL